MSEKPGGSQEYDDMSTVSLIAKLTHVLPYEPKNIYIKRSGDEWWLRVEWQ